MSIPRTLQWIGNEDGFLRMIDQTRLPTECREIDCRSVESVWDAIRMLRVRGAPAIGVAAAYGVVIGLQQTVAADRRRFEERLDEVCEYLASSRPTAVNLFWALRRQQQCARRAPELSSRECLSRLLQEAARIDEEDRAMCAAIGRHGGPLLGGLRGVLTHCNAGGLATAGDGTALSVIFAAARVNPALRVFADETRPLLQGARLTAWELQQRHIDVTVICDSAAALVMQRGLVQAVITGADRIAANGDAANKIGTYALALLAEAHTIPFYIAAPSSTFDLTLPEGGGIPIEERSAEEVTEGFGTRTAPVGVPAYNPAFDVTPARLIDALITERGVIRPVDSQSIREVLSPSSVES